MSHAVCKPEPIPSVIDVKSGPVPGTEMHGHTTCKSSAGLHARASRYHTLPSFPDQAVNCCDIFIVAVAKNRVEHEP